MLTVLSFASIAGIAAIDVVPGEGAERPQTYVLPANASKHLGVRRKGWKATLVSHSHLEDGGLGSGPFPPNWS